jgi:hypothetical protein
MVLLPCASVFARPGICVAMRRVGGFNDRVTISIRKRSAHWIVTAVGIGMSAPPRAAEASADLSDSTQEAGSKRTTALSGKNDFPRE